MAHWIYYDHLVLKNLLSGLHIRFAILDTLRAIPENVHFKCPPSPCPGGFLRFVYNLSVAVTRSKTLPGFITSTPTWHVLELCGICPKNVLTSDLSTVQGSGCWDGCQGELFHPGRKFPQDSARPGSFSSLRRSEEERGGWRQEWPLEALRAGGKWPLLCGKASAERDWDAAAQIKTAHVLETAMRPHGGWNPESLGERSPVSLGRVRKARVDLSGHW